MSLKITFCRFRDRTPADHLYGDAFDEELSQVIGGKEFWITGEYGNPRSKFKDIDIEVELHENGPEFIFFVEHASEITSYISALTGLAALWISVRSERRKNQTEQEKRVNKCKTHTKIEYKDFKLEAPCDFDGAQLLHASKKIIELVDNDQ